MYRLVWDYDLLDVDADGLRAVEEVVAGTSDFFDDSDGDGFRDGMEVGATETDPTDPESLPPIDDAQGLPVRWVMSAFVRARIGSQGQSHQAFVDQGAFYSNDRSVRWFQGVGSTGNASSDWTLYSQEIPDGDWETQVTTDQLPALEGWRITVFPVDAERAYIVTRMDPFDTVYFADGGELTVLLDERQARYESALFAVTDQGYYNLDLNVRNYVWNVDPIGYVDEYDRLCTGSIGAGA